MTPLEDEFRALQVKGAQTDTLDADSAEKIAHFELMTIRPFAGRCRQKFCAADDRDPLNNSSGNTVDILWLLLRARPLPAQIWHLPFGAW